MIDVIDSDPDQLQYWQLEVKNDSTKVTITLTRLSCMNACSPTCAGVSTGYCVEAKLRNALDGLLGYENNVDQVWMSYRSSQTKLYNLTPLSCSGQCEPTCALDNTAGKHFGSRGVLSLSGLVTWTIVWYNSGMYN